MPRFSNSKAVTVPIAWSMLGPIDFFKIRRWLTGLVASCSFVSLCFCQGPLIKLPEQSCVTALK